MGDITVTDLQRGKKGFALTATSTDVSDCRVLKAAPAISGQSHYIERVILMAVTATQITLGAGGTAGGGSVTAAILDSVALGATSWIEFEFADPIKVGADTNITVDATGSQDIRVFLEGYTE